MIAVPVGGISVTSSSCTVMSGCSRMALSTAAEKADAVHRERAAGGYGIFVCRAHDEGIQHAHLGLEQPHGV